MARVGECAYCGMETELTREHGFPRWLPGKIPDSDSYTPVRGVHMFAGELTIEDVCARCNNGPLSRLDEYADEWWDRNVRSDVSELNAHEPTLGRWIAKITFNMQRIDRREHPRANEPPFPEDAIAWIMGDNNPRDSLGIAVAALPTGHHSALNAGHDGPRTGVPFPLRFTHFLGLVFMVVWRAPNVEVPPSGMTKIICDTMPGVPLDLERGRGPRRLPTIKHPDFVEKGLYENLPLMTRLVERWKREDAARS